MSDDTNDLDGGLGAAVDTVSLRLRGAEASANAFARAMTGAFASGIVHGRELDDILKSLALRLSDLALRMAMQPFARALMGGFGQAFSGPLGQQGGGLGSGFDSFGGGAGIGGGPVAPVSVNVQVTTPDLDSFRRSESYIAGQIARAVVRGQRTM